MELPVIAVKLNALTQELFFHWFWPPKTTVRVEALVDGEWIIVQPSQTNNSNNIKGLNQAVALKTESGIPQVARAIATPSK